MHKIKELKIWNKAIDLTVKVYKATENFPTEEKYGLTSQIRRSAVSVPSNISEGAGRNTKGEFKQFLGIANGSAGELETQILLAEEEYKHIDFTKAEGLVIEVQKMLHSMIIRM